MNLHNLLHYLRLRIDSHAQREIREYASAMMELISPIVPHTINAFKKYKINSITLSQEEITAIQNKEKELSTKRETKEFAKKLELLKLE